LNSGYGQGTYVASDSSEFNTTSFGAWQAFDKTTGAQWSSGNGTYSSSAPYGALSTAPITVDVSGNSYQGEWLQIQMPVSIVLSTYVLYGVSGNNQMPYKWWILGSRDGINWSLVDSRGTSTLSSSTGYQYYNVGASHAFNFYRFVTNQISQLSGTFYCVTIIEWVLNGTIEGPTVSADGRLGVGVSAPVQQLEVAGSAVVAGTLSAGNPLMFRNRIINGDMMIAQRGASTSITNQTLTYSTDRFFSYYTFSGGALTTYQNTLSVTDAPYQQGLLYSTNVACTSTLSGTAGGASLSGQVMEGFSARDFGWGTSLGVPVTLSFWFKSNLSGYTSASIRNKTAYNWSWTSPQLTYSTAGVWQYYTMTVPPPPNGSAWGSGNASFAEVIINGFQAGVSTTGWNNSTSMGYSGQIFPSTSGNYVAFTGVQLEKGTIATPFEVRPYATELALCQRYYWAHQGGGSVKMLPDYSASTGRFFATSLPVTMRGTPTPTATVSSGTGSNYGCTVTMYGWQVSGVTSTTSVDISAMTASAEL